jgi:hypothetical protein
MFGFFLVFMVFFTFPTVWTKNPVALEAMIMPYIKV